MSSITTWLWGTSQLDDAVDKATSELLPSGAEDIALNLEICDQIRSKSIPAKDAMRALKRRLDHKNPNVQLLALGLTDICIKNGGDHFLLEVASREFMDNLVSILKIPALNLEVKNTITRLIQNWATAFEGKVTLQYVGQVYKNLKSEGFKFPPQDLAVANSVMVDTQTAPEWIDSDVCLRCRTAFTFTNRKHHCRNCGQVFDQQCSSKTMPLPHFGITQEVRICDGCHSKLSKKGEKTCNGADKAHRHSASHPGSRHRSAREAADAELQRAIQLSLQEVGATSGHARPGYVPSQPPIWQYSEPPLVDSATRPSPNDNSRAEEDDPDLRAAIEASLREANAPRPSAPIAVETPRTEQSFSYSGPAGYSQSYPPGVVPPHPSVQASTYDLELMESDAILTFSQTVEHVQGQGGRDMSRFPAVNELYDRANSLRPKLAMSLDDTGRKEQMLSDMNDKLSQAVRLYDKLLTEQISKPRWRSSQPVSPVSYQQPNSTGYSTANGYNRWAPSQIQAPVTMTPPESSAYEQSLRQPQVMHRSYSTSSSVQEYQQPKLVGSPEQGQPYQARDASQQQWYPQQPQYVEPTHYQPLSAPVSSQPQSQYNPQQQNAYAEPSQQPQYAQQQPQQQYSAPTSAPQFSPLLPSQVSGPSYQSQTPTPASLSISSQYAPPPAPQSPVSSKAHPPPSPVLARHNTISYASSPPPLHPQTINNHSDNLSRHNTIAGVPKSPQQQTQQYHPQPQQPHARPVTPPSLPVFPVVPTSAPQSFSLYAQSVPSGIVQPERKEALLIDL